MLTLVTAPRWTGLVAHVSAWLRDALTDPFDSARIVVSGAGAGRLLGQELARLDGISAGVEAVSPARWVRDLAVGAGLEDQWRAWQGQALVVAVLDQLDAVAAHNPLLAAHLAQDRPTRSLTIAARVAGLFRRYALHAPHLVTEWLGGGDAGPQGKAIPAHLSWQPALYRLAVEHLHVDPLALQESLVHAAAQDPTPLGVLAVDEVSPLHLRMLSARGRATPLPLWQLNDSVGHRWAREVATETVHLGGDPRPAPQAELHESHGPLRQAEVLRERLTQLFDDDPSLEPRDVLIVCPHPEAYASALDSVFGATDEPGSHPGRTLRLQPQAFRGRINPALELLEALVALPVSRASAPELTALLLSPPIAHRWGLVEHADEVAELVAEAGIRWGLDSAHRARFGLDGLPQGTWLSGLDSLLTGLALARGSAPVLAAPAAQGVSPSDLEIVGSLCEVLSRLRKFVAESTTPATVVQWVRRLRTALEELAGLPASEARQLVQAHSALTDLERSGPGGRQLTRAEFARLLSAALPGPARRTPAGNGAIQVVGLGELLHVDFRVVVLLGPEDESAAVETADSIDLGDLMPDLRRRRLDHVLAHARSAERLLVVRRGFSERTNARVPTPVLVSRLWHELGVTPSLVVRHAATTVGSASRPGHGAGFDALAHEAACARRARDRRLAAEPTAALAPWARRRLAAASLPIGDPPSPEQAERVTIADLVAFLDNPAKAFLRARMGVTYFPPPELREELPLSLAGLDAWQIQDFLLRAAKDGTDPAVARTDARRQVSVPPGSLGAAVVDEALDLVRGLWGQAAGQWQAAPTEHQLELDLGGIVLTDTVHVRGGDVVAVTVSQGPKTLLAPWLSMLALSATGTPAGAVVHRVAKFRGQPLPESRRIATPSADQALAVLRTVAAAYRIGRQQLLAVPLQPAVTLVQELGSREGIRLADWHLPSSEFRAPWRFRHESWDLFFGDRAAELFDDPAGPLDPPFPHHLLRDDVPPLVARSRFASWALALYRPLLNGGSE
ncbi:exodeoxyribonuclease V subunit gamma [Tessaracoccus caeni]|uniref:exodeoxyribonuclease V subunit gamma n=1 Tax=Tessaracoccus caeni TaxID=3031239 RepID=UPI0023DA553D|nr:exodeoxyribonuclease V subunit gamma [Tessaracoccus caeni]MDF1486792.1 exodeoxyribonuclease V subunit gamma [Tessaracoccus caeni]